MFHTNVQGKKKFACSCSFDTLAIFVQKGFCQVCKKAKKAIYHRLLKCSFTEPPIKH